MVTRTPGSRVAVILLTDSFLCDFFSAGDITVCVDKLEHDICHHHGPETVKSGMLL